MSAVQFEALRISTDANGFHDLRTGERNEAPDSDLIASCVRDDYLALFAAAPEMLAELIRVEQTAKALGLPSMAATVRAAIAKATGAAA